MEPEGVIEVRLDPSHPYLSALGKGVLVALFRFCSGCLMNKTRTQDLTVLLSLKPPDR